MVNYSDVLSLNGSPTSYFNSQQCHTNSHYTFLISRLIFIEISLCFADYYYYYYYHE